jgi:hypothetical protein
MCHARPLWRLSAPSRPRATARNAAGLGLWSATLSMIAKSSPDTHLRIEAGASELRTGRPPRARPRHSPPRRGRRVAPSNRLKTCRDLLERGPIGEAHLAPSRRAGRRKRGAAPCASRRRSAPHGVMWFRRTGCLSPMWSYVEISSSTSAGRASRRPNRAAACAKWRTLYVTSASAWPLMAAVSTSSSVGSAGLPAAAPAASARPRTGGTAPASSSGTSNRSATQSRTTRLAPFRLLKAVTMTHVSKTIL